MDNKTMDKIIVSISGKVLSVTLTAEKAEELFAKISGILLDRVVAGENQTAAEDSPKHTKQAGESEGYTGFLRITCEKCGAIKSFKPKEPVTEFRCEQCGAVTPLKDLNSANFNCKCEKSWGYKTNARERIIEQPCIACGSPMTAQQDKHGNYKPV